ncbi:MAG: hypothetical protein Q4F31_10320 [Eubacteriales bacterium]|nr:hypothetical protein [Eubacteriales bacterium]
MRRIISLLLAFTMILPLGCFAFAYEEEKGTPYGIPIYNSIEKVNLHRVLQGNQIKRVLEHTNNLEFEMTFDSNIEGKKSNMFERYDVFKLGTDHYYFGRTEIDYSFGYKVHYQYESGINDPIMYVKIGLGNFKDQVEYSDEDLEATYLSTFFAPGGRDDAIINISKYEEAYGYYVFYYDATFEKNGIKYINNDCRVVINPKTSLITEAKYFQQTEDGSKTWNVRTTVKYGLDMQPDNYAKN